MVNYVHEHDFTYGCIYMCIREETSSHGLKTLTKSSDPKICIFMGFDLLFKMFSCFCFLVMEQENFFHQFEDAFS